MWYGVLTNVAQLAGCHPAKQKVIGLIPSQGTCLGFSFGPSRGAQERQPIIDVLPHIDVSLPLSLPSPSLNINK